MATERFVDDTDGWLQGAEIEKGGNKQLSPLKSSCRIQKPFRGN